MAGRNTASRATIKKSNCGNKKGVGHEICGSNIYREDRNKMTLKLLMTESLNGVTVVKKGLLEIRAARRGGRQSRTMQNRYRAAYYSPLCFYTTQILFG